MISPNDFWQQHSEDLGKLSQLVSARRMIVTGVRADGMVQVAEPGGDTHIQFYARIGGFLPAVDDEVLVQEIPAKAANGTVQPGTRVVVGILVRAAPTLWTLDAGLLVSGNTTLGESPADSVTKWGHQTVLSGVPTITPGAAIGSAGTVSVTDCNDEGGRFAVLPGGSGIAAGVLCTVTFANARPNANYDVLVQPCDAVAILVRPYCLYSSRTVNAFTINTPDVPVSGSSHRFFFRVTNYA